ncbi:inactive tyrosine-protein kinase 7 isoform X2 [Rhinatrema bivittatum]|uniref:inactive tyrosine-protein kinase 7 isoform X2 n=1 Tax=Rhinatrema bivittatum TaxID=194408 RepID=UPI00112C37D1|nr:inactive tyrosine-protein kinase 7 isoform X2 [Rhinatrema bivittatum]
MGERGRRRPLLLLLFLLGQGVCIRSAILFTKEPYSQDALNGRAAILRCEVADPAHVEFEWLQNGISITDTERRFKEGSNLQFTAVDWKQDTGNFQCVAKNNMTGEEAHTANASFNIKWIESGAVVLKDPATIAEVQSTVPVTLRCHIDGHPRPACQWFRDGLQITDDGINYSISNKERTLTLRSASPEDNGIYYCCARNAMGLVCSNANFTLNIIDETFPRPVLIPGNQIVNKNEEAIFHCQFTAMPPPVQKWYFESSSISNNSRFTLFSNGSLLITQVKAANAGTYRCEGHGQRGKPVVLEATLHLAEIKDMKPFSGKEFTANTVQRIICNPPWGRPEPTVWWEREGVQIPPKDRVYQDGNELVFNPIAEKDAGIYTCHAANQAGERKQDVNITVATIPKWLEMPTDSSLEESKPGYLHCLTKASLKPTVDWYRSGNRISEDSRFLIFENGTLRINSVEVYDGTVYKCVSSTAAGSIAAQARVTVLEKLKFTPPPQPQQCLEYEREATLLCSATGREKPTIRWMKADGSSLQAHVESNSGILHFHKVIRSDASNYTCIAWNSQQGEIRAVVQLIVAVFISFKLEPENTTVYQGHTAVLHCQALGDPLPQVQWKVKEHILDSSKHAPRIQVMSNSSLVIYDVTSEDSGKYTCIAGNICNIKHKDVFLYVVDKPITDTMEPGSHTPYKMIQTIGLSVGAAVAYIIIVLGLMFYCKKRRKARRLQKRPDAEEPEMECLNGGALLQNGQTTAEIREEVALTNLGSGSSTNKRHSAADKMHFPRASLQTITMLGKSEFGDVFLAKAKGIQDGETETVVLVKSLQTRDEQFQLNFRREFEMFAKLNHVNVVRLLGLCRELEPHYMILEYVDLGDLKQYLKISRSKDEKLKPQPISTKQKVSICTQVALGMEHLSNSRFVHKDLAARNCLVSAQRQVKVSALSLSKDVYNSEYYHFHQAWIPLRWMPPEAVLEDEFSTKSDVWSFGVLMWEVFTQGELPHSKLADDEVLAGQCFSSWGPPEGRQEREAGLLLLVIPELLPQARRADSASYWYPTLPHPQDEEHQRRPLLPAGGS